MIKVLITDKLAQQGIDLLNSIEGVEAVVKTGISEDELAQIIGEHDGLIIRSGTKVTAKVLANSIFYLLELCGVTSVSPVVLLITSITPSMK